MEGVGACVVLSELSGRPTGRPLVRCTRHRRLTVNLLACQRYLYLTSLIAILALDLQRDLRAELLGTGGRDEGVRALDEAIVNAGDHVSGLQSCLVRRAIGFDLHDLRAVDVALRAHLHAQGGMLDLTVVDELIGLSLIHI